MKPYIYMVITALQQSNRSARIVIVSNSTPTHFHKSLDQGIFGFDTTWSRLLWEGGAKFNQSEAIDV